MGIRNRLGQAVVAVALVAGAALASTAPAAAAVQTCAQLQARYNLLENLAAHVTDPAAQDKLYGQALAVMDQMEAQGCFDLTSRTFTDTITVWTDSSLAPGPSTRTVTLTLRFQQDGTLIWSLPAIDMGSVTITQNGNNTSGSWNTAGHLTLTAPIKVHTSYGDGTSTLTISTDQSISTPSGTFTGAPLSSPSTLSGSVTLTGTTSVTISILTVHAQAAFVGTVS
jgi:hypothetical protein